MKMSRTNVPEDVKERIKASYDIIAPKYNEWTVKHIPLRQEYTAKVFEFISASGPLQQPRFLELGCGAGLPITKKLLSHPEAHVTANDISTTQIELARKNLLGAAEENARSSERLALIEGDMTKLSFTDQSFDAVFAFYSLIHLPRTEQTEMVGKIARWLKPGGYLVANFFDSDKEAVVMEKWLDKNDWMFWSSWGKEETLKIIEEAGFQVVASDVRKDEVNSSFLWVVGKR
ncbi:Sterol 24-C-methyltransferase erg-4 [Daldinia childiae]|uniref:Sterol 24-C-methyltransferase erg-4 n=1 Tax=Daldinia childiae TaxID=326645 RepID=UPI001444E327|nr:Sterol 24-C-methyltransferase erg-4 [Daldinia childiae]KAF3062109.1 Sterol 24-C-methyltransferase erg-4 [Daldinia childiae]